MIQKQADLFHFCLKLKQIVKDKHKHTEQSLSWAKQLCQHRQKTKAELESKVQKSFPKSIEYLKCSMTRLTFTFTLFHLAPGYQVYAKYLSLGLLELIRKFIEGVSYIQTCEAIGMHLVLPLSTS